MRTQWACGLALAPRNPPQGQISHPSCVGGTCVCVGIPIEAQVSPPPPVLLPPPNFASEHLIRSTRSGQPLDFRPISGLCPLFWRQKVSLSSFPYRPSTTPCPGLSSLSFPLGPPNSTPVNPCFPPPSRRFHPVNSRRCRAPASLLLPFHSISHPPINPASFLQQTTTTIPTIPTTGGDKTRQLHCRKRRRPNYSDIWFPTGFFPSAFFPLQFFPPRLFVPQTRTMW